MGVTYSHYNYWTKKLNAEAESRLIAPIHIRKEDPHTPDGVSMAGVNSPGITLVFPNGVKPHFERGSEAVLMEVLTQSTF